MFQTKTVAVEVEELNIQRLWDESDLVTDWSVFPDGDGVISLGSPAKCYGLTVASRPLRGCAGNP